MNRKSLRGGTAVIGAAVLVSVSLAAATEAASTYERVLAGVRLNSTAKAVLAKYGNPNDVVVGDVGARQGTTAGGAAAGAFPGGGGLPGLGGGAASPFGARGGSQFGPGGPTGFPGGGSGFPGAPGGFPGGSGFPGAPGGFPGGFPGSGDENAPVGVPGQTGGFGGGRATVAGIGATSSAVARQQEVTWIYNREFKDKKGAQQLVSYEFLLGPSGNVEQIRVSGYTGGVKTSRGIGLGSTYRDVIRAYGYPEEHADYGNVLVASYRNAAHVQFQFLNDRVLNSSTTALNPGDKVIGITIATVE